MFLTVALYLYIIPYNVANVHPYFCYKYKYNYIMRGYIMGFKNVEFKELWPTTIACGTWDSLELVNHILTTLDMNNLQGEVNGFNIFENDSKELTEFRDTAYTAFDRYLYYSTGKHISDYKSHTMKGWITGHGEDYSMTIHNHSGAHLSAVFYAMAADQNSGGDIVFTDPRANANRGYDDWFDPMFKQHTHTPKTGDWMVFPSFTYHHVNPYFSRMRICIPVDLYLHRD